MEIVQGLCRVSAWREISRTPNSVLYIFDTVDKYPQPEAYTENKILLGLSHESPSYNARRLLCYTEILLDCPKDWHVFSEGMGRYSIIVGAYTDNGVMMKGGEVKYDNV